MTSFLGPCLQFFILVAYASMGFNHPAACRSGGGGPQSKIRPQEYLNFEPVIGL